MKKKTFALFGVTGLLFSLILGASSVEAADGDQVCKTYRNYYFFSEINHASHYEEKLPDSSSTYERNHTTYSFNSSFPAGLSSNDIIEQGQIRLSKTATENTNDVWSLDYFYDKFKVAYNTERVAIEETSDKTIRYLTHGSWYSQDGQIQEKTIDFTNIDSATLALGSIIPTETTAVVTFNADFTYVSANLLRTIHYNDIYDSNGDYKDGVVPFELEWSENSTTAVETLLTPALYYVEYEHCSTAYKAQIDYLNKATEEKVANSYTENSLVDGYTKEVTSPEIDGCALDVPSQETVNVNIAGKDFYEKVYYVCPMSTVTENPKTGDSLIYIVWAIGALALGYSIYYFNRYYKKEKEM